MTLFLLNSDAVPFGSFDDSHRAKSGRSKESDVNRGGFRLLASFSAYRISVSAHFLFLRLLPRAESAILALSPAPSDTRRPVRIKNVSISLDCGVLYRQLGVES